MTILCLRSLLDLKSDFNRFCCCCCCCWFTIKLANVHLHPNAKANWTYVPTIKYSTANGFFFWSFKSIYEIPLAIRIALQCIAIQWDRTIRTMFMAVSRRPNISNFIIVKRWHEYSCKTPPRLSLLQNRKTFNAHRNWWMHANQPQYINWNGKIEFYSSNTMCNWRTATTTATKKKQNTCNRRYTEEKKQRKKNGIELNICHLYWFATYTRANNIVVNIDRWGNYFRLWWFFFRFVSRFMAFFLCTFFQLLYSLFSATLFLTVILKVI